MNHAYSPEALAAREEIRDCLHTYCRAVDRGQTDLLECVFHPGSTINCGPYKGSIAGFAQLLDERRASVPRAVHMLGNVMFDFADGERALVESYCLAMEEFMPESNDAPGLNRLARVRYLDDFECRAGAWKIVHRVIVIDHTSAPIPADTGDFFKGPAGRRDEQDLALLRRTAFLAAASGSGFDRRDRNG
jgi:hypothetical protein